MPNQIKVEEAVRAAITQAEDLGYRVEIDNWGQGQWNVWLRQGPDHPNPTSIVTWRKYVLRSDIAEAIDEMLKSPKAESVAAYMAERER